MDIPAKHVTHWWAAPAIGVFLAGLALTLALWQHSVDEYRHKRELDFFTRDANLHRVVLQRLDIYSQALRGTAALFDASDDRVDRIAWRRFVAGMHLQENYPGLLAMAYAAYVDQSELESVIEQARRDGIAEYAMRPSGVRRHYVVNTYVEPMTAENRRALGYDMYQDAERRRVMDIARDTATARITGKISIKIDTEPNPRPAFIMYLPVYRGGTPDTVEERRKRLIGFVLCPFRMPELMPALLGGMDDNFGFALYDGDTEDESRLFYRNAAFDQAHTPLLRKRQVIEFGGRTWTMILASTPAFENHPGRYWPYTVLGIGLAVTITLSAILFFMAVARRRAIVLAERMTGSLRASEARWQSLFSQAPLGIMVLDRDSRITACNRALCKIFGAEREQLIGFNIIDNAPDSALEPWLSHSLMGGQVSFEIFYNAPVGNGKGYFRFHFQPIQQGGDFSMLLCFIEDVSEQHRAAERIATLAHRDNLTGLANRALLNDRLAHAVAVAARERKMLAVLFLDLDHFKTINDSLGHTLGDTVLVESAQRIAAHLRKSDTVARLGGDEFVIVLPDAGSAERVSQVAQKIMESITAPIALVEHRLNLTCSIGIALFPSDGHDAETLIKNADTAMYHAKENGRNSFQFFTVDMNVRVVEALAMEAALRQALREREFALHYQPQLSIDGRTLVGVEALIRWQRPGFGTMPPALFIPMAEERGLIGAIGEWALHEACRQNRRWQESGLPAIPVSVNISALQLRNHALVGSVCSALTDSGLDPRYLELEITESALAHNIDFAIALIAELKALGIRIAIDDFGTGYSSLSYLKRFPIDKLKIDRSFIRDITSDQNDAAITEAIVAMGRSLGMKVIAEGVETVEQLRFLQRHRCDEAQGYWFSRPLAADPMAQFLERYQTAVVGDA